MLFSSLFSILIIHEPLPIRTRSSTSIDWRNEAEVELAPTPQPKTFSPFSFIPSLPHVAVNVSRWHCYSFHFSSKSAQKWWCHLHVPKYVSLSPGRNGRWCSRSLVALLACLLQLPRILPKEPLSLPRSDSSPLPLLSSLPLSLSRGKCK